MPPMNCLVALFVAACCVSSAAAQTIVARVHFEAPVGPRFVLRTVLPLPEGRDPALPLCVRFPDRDAPVPVQTIAVARDAAGRVETVEIVAASETPPNWKSGSTLVASVLDGPAPTLLPARAPRLDTRIAELLDKAQPGRLYLRTWDVHGNEYRADLSGVPRSAGFQVSRLLDNGPLLLRRRVASVFVPVGSQAAEGPPLPHLMGVHAYIVERADLPALSLDVRVHNGLAGAEGSAHPLEVPLGPVWFKAIELVAPADFVVEADVKDSACGAPRVEGASFVLPLVAASADGRLQCMPAQARFHRRLVLRTQDAGWAARDLSGFRDLGFPVGGTGLWSWEAFPRWFAQRERLPSASIYATPALDGAETVRQRDAQELERLTAVLKSGKAQKWPYLADAMGWCHPWLEQQQGTTGGFGIVLSEGHWSAVAASRAGLQRLALQHRMSAERQPQAAWDRWGRPLSAELWLDKEGRVPFDYRMNGDVRPQPFAGRARVLPEAQAQARVVDELGLRPAWDRGDPYAKRTEAEQGAANIHAWWPFDDQHLVRWTAAPKALVWAANDPLARDDLLATAELARLALHEFPHGGSAWGASATLPVLEKQTKAWPHAGLPWGRGEAWMIDAMAAAHAVADDAWRGAHRGWFERVADLLLESAMQTGLVMRVHNARHKESGRYDTAQSFECILLLHAERSLAEGVFGAADPQRRDALRALQAAACRRLASPPLWQEVRDERDGLRRGPRQIFAVAYKDRPQTPPFGTEPHWRGDWLPESACEGGVEAYWTWSALARGVVLAGDGLDGGFGAKLLQLGAGAADQASLWKETARLARNASTDNTANMLELLRLWDDAGTGRR